MPIEPLDKKIKAFGFNLYEINGNDPKEIIETLSGLQRNGKPHAVIANTTKGKGISFIENQPAWHHKTPTNEELNIAMEELK